MKQVFWQDYCYSRRRYESRTFLCLRVTLRGPGPALTAVRLLETCQSNWEMSPWFTLQNCWHSSYFTTGEMTSMTVAFFQLLSNCLMWWVKSRSAGDRPGNRRKSDGSTAWQRREQRTEMRGRHEATCWPDCPGQYRLHTQIRQSGHCTAHCRSHSQLRSSILKTLVNFQQNYYPYQNFELYWSYRKLRRPIGFVFNVKSRKIFDLDFCLQSYNLSCCFEIFLYLYFFYGQLRFACELWNVNNHID